MGKRTFVIGDVHGELPALKALVHSMNLRADDELIFLGDTVDKGPNTRDTIDFLIDLSAKQKCTFVRGNHEELMLAAIIKEIPRAQEIWLRHGGKQTLTSYGAQDIKDLQSIIPKRHIQFLENMIDAHITKNHIFVHAGWDSRKTSDQQTVGTLRYQFMNVAKPDKTLGKTVVCGHSSLMTGKPAAKGNILCIDTIEYGWLTAYELSSETFLQANSHGKTRRVKRAEKFSQKRHVPKRFRI